MLPFLFAAALLTGSQGDQTSLQAIRDAASSGSKPRILRLFKDPADAQYLLEMGARSGGLGRLHAAIIPAPPGWLGVGPYVVVLHEWQEVEAEHDPVYGTVRSADGSILLGREIPEDASPQEIVHLRADVRLHPEQSAVDVDSTVEVDGNAAQTPLFRINDNYRLTGPGKVWNADAQLPKPAAGDLVQAGSLVLKWTAATQRSYRFTYTGVLRLKEQRKVEASGADTDSLDDTACFLTSFWTPSLGRNPQTTDVRIVGPKDWVLRSEGVAVPDDGTWPKLDAGGDEQVAIYHNTVPISFPKVVGGRYKVAAELIRNGMTFRSYQFEPVDAKRGEDAVRRMADALDQYEKWLGPFPYPSYELFDGRDYYGIESYSYTVLAPRISAEVTHELGHTYFGGLVPCTYVHDTWNEGLTQYLDSVLRGKDEDGTLEAGLATVKLAKPLTKMDIAWGDAGATYFRGAYVMKMLEAQIGQDNVIAGLRAMVKDRVGKDTRWKDIRQYMEQSSQDPLDWFWAQWVDGGVFPTLEITDVQRIQKENKYQTLVTLTQTGTPAPFRLRFVVKIAGEGLSQEQFVDMAAPSQVFSFDTDFAPNEATLNVFPYALATVKGPFEIRGTRVR